MSPHLLTKLSPVLNQLDELDKWELLKYLAKELSPLTQCPHCQNWFYNHKPLTEEQRVQWQTKLSK